MKTIRLFFMIVLVSMIFMGCGEATKSAAIPSENSLFGISEMNRVDSSRNTNISDKSSFLATALLIFLI